MRKILLGAKFKKDYKRMLKQSFCDTAFIEEFNEVISKLANDLPLDTDTKKYFDHQLKGKNKHCRELHLMPDWLLMYSKSKSQLKLMLIRTGTHQDLFGE